MEVRERKPNPTIEYLNQALHADRQIDSLIEHSQRCMEHATRATSRLTATRIGGTGRRSNVEDAVLAMVDLSREIERETNLYIEKVREIRAVIAKVPDNRHRLLLRWRYVNGWRWDRIAEGLNVSDRSWVWELHGKALLEVEKVRAQKI